jgi:hypothetical protein
MEDITTLYFDHKPSVKELRIEATKHFESYTLISWDDEKFIYKIKRINSMKKKKLKKHLQLAQQTNQETIDQVFQNHTFKGTNMSKNTEVEISCATIPRVYILPEAKSKLDLYIKLCKYEISGLGSVIKRDDVMLIQDIFLFKQVVTSGSTDLNEEAISNFLLETVKAGLDPETLKLWWHSHGNGGCFWSGTDTSTIELFKNEWMISIVGNRQGDYQTRVDLYNPFRVSIDKIKLQLFQPVDEVLREQLREEINSKVTAYVYTIPKAGFGGNQDGIVRCTKCQKLMDYCTCFKGKKTSTRSYWSDSMMCPVCNQPVRSCVCKCPQCHRLLDFCECAEGVEPQDEDGKWKVGKRWDDTSQKWVWPDDSGR